MPLHAHADIPFGNACEIEVIPHGDATTVAFTPDPHGGTECWWFCLRIERRGDVPGRIRLVLKHMQNILAGLSPELPDTLRPVVRYDGEDWQRLPGGEGRRTDDGQRQGVWMLDAPSTFVDIASCYPYGPWELRRLIHDTTGKLRLDTIGVSQRARPIERVSNDVGSDGAERPGVYLLARQHAGETPGSWVLDGFLRHAVELGTRAPLIWSVPLCDIDGIEAGDYGKDNFPWDLNRAWGSPAMRHEVLVLQRDMRLWASRCAPKLVIDLHAPAPGEAHGIYAFIGNGHDPDKAHPGARAWAEAIGPCLGGLASEPFARMATHGSRWKDQPRLGEFAESIGAAGLSFECPYSSINGRVLERETYREAGARIAAAVADRLAG